VHPLLLLHASRASIDPVAEFYGREAADLSPVSILDEGVMGELRRREWTRAATRLVDLIHQAVERYGTRAVLVTCSALDPRAMAVVRAASPVPALKIDEPMLAEAAREWQGKVGLVATFASTVETSETWLRHFRPDIEIETVCDTEALERLLAGDREEHDRRLLAAAEAAAARGVEGLVLAQVSMARLAPAIRARTGLPVLESLTTSLAGLRVNDKL
jgi:aspartate/glutamate racemase